VLTDVQFWVRWRCWRGDDFAEMIVMGGGPSDKLVWAGGALQWGLVSGFTAGGVAGWRRRRSDRTGDPRIRRSVVAPPPPQPRPAVNPDTNPTTCNARARPTTSLVAGSTTHYRIISSKINPPASTAIGTQNCTSSARKPTPAFSATKLH